MQHFLRSTCPWNPFPTRHAAGHIWGSVVTVCLFLSGLPGRFCLYLKLTWSNRISGDLGIFIPHIHSAVLVFYFCFAVHIFFSAGGLRCCVEERMVWTASCGNRGPTLVPPKKLSPWERGQGLGCTSKDWGERRPLGSPLSSDYSAPGEEDRREGVSMFASCKTYLRK